MKYGFCSIRLSNSRGQAVNARGPGSEPWTWKAEFGGAYFDPDSPDTRYSVLSIRAVPYM